MTLTFGTFKPLPNPHVAETFEVVITTMSGDADAYDEIVIGPFDQTNADDLAAVEHLLRTVSKMEAEYPNGRGGSSDYDYDHIEGFDVWFRDDYPDEPLTGLAAKAAAFIEKLEDYPYWWPYDVTGAECQQDCKSYKVLYYSNTLSVYEVEFDIS